LKWEDKTGFVELSKIIQSHRNIYKSKFPIKNKYIFSAFIRQFSLHFLRTANITYLYSRSLVFQKSCEFQVPHCISRAIIGNRRTHSATCRQIFNVGRWNKDPNKHFSDKGRRAVLLRGGDEAEYKWPITASHKIISLEMCSSVGG